MRRAFLLAIVAVGCLGPSEPISQEPADCFALTFDTTTWVRTDGPVSLLMPANFEQTLDYRWERAGTRIDVLTFEAGAVDPNTYEDFAYEGSCSGTIGAYQAVLDYGTIRHTGPVPEASIIATWRRVPLGGTSTRIVIDTRMRDHSEIRIIERIIHSARFSTGPVF